MNNLRTTVAFSLLVGLAVSGCGSSSSSNDPVALCKQSCTKAIDLCFADAGVEAAPFKTLCENQCASSTGAGTTCNNSAAVIAAIKVCQTKTTCDEYQSCALTVPKCTGGSGTGGSAGAGTGGVGAGTGGRAGTSTGGATGAGTGGTTTAGTGGAGGTSGAAKTCADLTTCCNRVANAVIKAACTMQVTTVMAQVASGQITQAVADQGCAQALMVGQSVYCP